MVSSGLWIPSKILVSSPGPSSTERGSPVDTTASPRPSPAVSSYTWIEARSPCISMISPIKRSAPTRTTSNRFASRIPSAITRGPDTFRILPSTISVKFLSVSPDRANENNSSLNRAIPLAAFSFGDTGAKEKTSKKKTPLREFRPLRRARRATRPPPRKLLKKLDQNF